MTTSSLLAGVELGGTKCICILGRGPGDIVDRVRLDTEDPETTMRGVEAVLDGWRDHYGFAALGIGSFGPIDVDRASPTYGSITTTPKPGWQDVDVAGRLARRYAIPAAFDTDVTGAALAEGQWGAAQGLSSFAYMTVGTGIGVGVIVGGRAITGLGHAEVGHMRVPRTPGDDWPGSCPYHGDCIEGLASGTAIEARLGRRGGGLSPNHAVWDLVADAIAHALHNLALTALPERVLIGGGVADAQPHLFARIRTKLGASLAGYSAHLRADTLEAYVAPPALGAMAGPLGTLALADVALLEDSKP